MLIFRKRMGICFLFPVECPFTWDTEGEWRCSAKKVPHAFRKSMMWPLYPLPFSSRCFWEQDSPLLWGSCPMKFRWNRLLPTKVGTWFSLANQSHPFPWPQWLVQQSSNPNKTTQDLPRLCWERRIFFSLGLLT